MAKDVYTHTHTHTHTGILFNHNTNEILSHTATWMDIKIIILSKVNQKKTNAVWYHLSVETKKKTPIIYLQNRNRLIDLKNLWLPKGKGGRVR